MNANFNESRTKKKYLITKTWQRDSHGLFDYESNSFFTKSYDINFNGYLSKKEHNIYYKPEETLETTTLAKINYMNKTLKSTRMKFNLPINNQTLIDLQENVWYAVKQNDHRTPPTYFNRSATGNKRRACTVQCGKSCGVAETRT